MTIHITAINQPEDNKSKIVLAESSFIHTLSDSQQKYIDSRTADKKAAFVNLYDSQIIVIPAPDATWPEYRQKEHLRVKSFEAYKMLAAEANTALEIIADQKNQALDMAEGVLLGAYRFTKYKADKDKQKETELKDIYIQGASKKEVEKLKNIVEATFLARDLVNEPLVTLTATELANRAATAGQEAGFEVEVLDKAAIEDHKMGGLLAVNKGSIDPPTFIIMTYTGADSKEEAPVVLVGKGVVFDTGGLSLKPTENSMDWMKCDMGGAATVIGTMYSIAKNKLPLNVTALVPATDNRPGLNAMVPSDIITMMSGTTVEVKNTDAEGRLILADALHYAHRYNPRLVVDVATLTGAAMRTFGKEASAFLSTAGTETDHFFTEAGFATYERVAQLPLWHEYEDMVKSDIADLQNMGGPLAGTITAAAFLKHFVKNLPWIHLDIAGTGFLPKPDSYRGKYGSGVGVRLLSHFLEKLQK